MENFSLLLVHSSSLGKIVPNIALTSFGCSLWTNSNTCTKPWLQAQVSSHENFPFSNNMNIWLSPYKRQYSHICIDQALLWIIQMFKALLNQAWLNVQKHSLSITSLFSTKKYPSVLKTCKSHFFKVFALAFGFATACFHFIFDWFPLPSLPFLVAIKFAKFTSQIGEYHSRNL